MAVESAGFWGGWTLATVANVSAVVLAVVAVAFAARAWLAGIILRWIGDKNQTWPIAADVLFSNATIRRTSTVFGAVDIHAEILLRPRWGTWTDRHYPTIISAVLLLRVGGKSHKHKFVVDRPPAPFEVHAGINQPREFLLKHTEKDILAYRLPKGGEAHFEFKVNYPPFRERRIVTEPLTVPALPDGKNEALNGGNRGWKMRRWGLRGLNSEHKWTKE